MFLARTQTAEGVITHGTHRTTDPEEKKAAADGARRHLSARVRANLQTLLERRFDEKMFLDWVAVAKLRDGTAGDVARDS